MFGDHETAHMVASHCMQNDIKCRWELRHGYIVSERDYVSILAARIRDDLRRLNIAAFSQTATAALENKRGIDALIIFRFKDEVKVGFYEAKWPRVRQKNYPWDYLEGTDKVSHFSSQIDRQHIWSRDIAIWEMFFNEGNSGFSSPPYDHFGSSCVWHPNAYRFMDRKGLIALPWTTSLLKQLIDTEGVSLYTIIYDILTCRKGKIFPVNLMKETISILNSSNNKDFLEIPLPRINPEEIDGRVEEFMIEQNIETYLYLNINSRFTGRDSDS